jgi:hypothetical protein
MGVASRPAPPPANSPPLPYKASKDEKKRNEEMARQISRKFSADIWTLLAEYEEEITKTVADLPSE